MKKVLVDSDDVIDYLRELSYTKRLMDRIRQRELAGYLSVVTLFELYVGGLLSANPQKRFEDVEKVLTWFEVVNIDKQAILVPSNAR